MSTRIGLALIGGRGHTGSALLPLIAAHSSIDLVLASSSSEAGTPLTQIDPAWPDPKQALVHLQPEGVAEVEAKVWVLALPNGASAPWVHAVVEHHPQAMILDLGADYRFETHSSWVYGLTEWQRPELTGVTRIANPGCYATAAQMALRPLLDLLCAPPVIFGLSGYSGAGKTPSLRNDPERLADNVIPYQLSGHMHEKEISFHLGQPVCFHPHVAPFFRGLSLTIHIQTKQPTHAEAITQRWGNVYAHESLIEVSPDIPEIRDVVGTPMLKMGGACVDESDPHHASFVVVLDNLLKGAASQAVQNINVALGLDELDGLGVVR